MLVPWAPSAARLGAVCAWTTERVKLGPFRMPALYVTVEDLEGLAAALAARGIVEVDARTDRTADTGL